MTDGAFSRAKRRRANVVIVGAAPAGLGMARVLRGLAIPDVLILELDQIGASFHQWPATMHFISPSFPGNAFGQTDLNAISFDSSPAFALKREHPNGPDYARYLTQAASVFDLSVETGVDVRTIDTDGNGFDLETSMGSVRASFVIWAAGQFQYPDLGEMQGAEHGVHSSRIRDWSEHAGGDIVVIGGYESGIDAAIGLARAGKSVTVLSRSASWESAEADPSIALSPYTKQRLEAALHGGSIKLVGDADILGLERVNGAVRVLTSDGRSWTSHGAPVLATGFKGSTHLLGDCFDWGNEGHPLFTPQNESTAMPGLFLVGPEVRHGSQLFCFIYKFHQRFAVVARAIAGRLGVDTEAREAYRANNMFLDELSCCEKAKCLC